MLRAKTLLKIFELFSCIVLWLLTMKLQDNFVLFYFQKSDHCYLILKLSLALFLCVCICVYGFDVVLLFALDKEGYV